MKNDKITEVDYSTTRIEEYSTIIFDLHKISKKRRNIYSFIHIHTNTSD